MTMTTIDPLTFKLGYYAVSDPDDPDVITCWKRTNHRTKKSRQHFGPWKRGMRYGPMKHITPADIPTDPEARQRFLTDFHAVGHAWGQLVLAAIAADPDKAQRLFASFTSHCMACGRKISADEAKLSGLGSDCRKQLNPSAAGQEA